MAIYYQCISLFFINIIHLLNFLKLYYYTWSCLYFCRRERGGVKMFGLAVKDDFTTEYSLFKDNNSGFLTDRTCGFLTDRTVVFLLTGQWFSYWEVSGFLTDSVISEVSSYVVNPVSRCHRLMKKKNKNINDDWWDSIFLKNFSSSTIQYLPNNPNI